MKLIRSEGCEPDSEDEDCVAQPFLRTDCSKFPTKLAYTSRILRVKTTMKYVRNFLPETAVSIDFNV